MLINELQKIGFSDKEAAVYLAGLELGQATILEIAKKAKIKRPTAYVIVEGFIKRGLASSFEKGKKRYFAMESPERLLTMFRLREKELQEQEREFSSVLSDLKQIYSSGLLEGKPVVRFFEGKEGVKAIQEDILLSKAKVLREFTDIAEAYKHFPEKPYDHRHKFQKSEHEIRTLYTSKKGPMLPAKQGPFISVFVSPDNFPFFCDGVIYNNKLALIAYQEKIMGVIIENIFVAKTLASIFDMAWAMATKN